MWYFLSVVLINLVLTVDAPPSPNKRLFKYVFQNLSKIMSEKTHHLCGLSFDLWKSGAKF